MHIRFLLLSLISSACFAVVPTTDMYNMQQDTTTTAQYAGQVSAYLGQIGSTMNAAQQAQNLKGLAAVQGAGNQLCALCNKSDIATLNQYSNDINGDLCQQFSMALTNITGTKSAITTLQGIMATFATNPKAAGLALQQAAVATQTATQNTMAQMQMLQAQVQQKQLADENIAKAQQSSMQDSMATAGGW